MAKYEILFIVRPDATEESLDQLIAQMSAIVPGTGGKTERVDKMGRRRLAHRVARQREGFYVLFTLEGGGEMVREFERRLRVNDQVIKFMTVRLDERLKRAAKLRAEWAERDAKRHRGKPPAPPAATRPAEAPTQG